ncbi:MAG: ATP-binding protein [Vicinamibacterales bacterium]
MAARQSAPADSTRRADDPLGWEPTQAFLRYSVAAIVVGGLCMLIALRVLVPEQRLRAAMVSTFVIIGLVSGGLLWSGRTRASFLTQALGVWTYVTLAAFLFGGVDAVSVAIYPLLVLMVGWLVHARAAILLAAVTSTITLGFALAQIAGALPSAPPTSPLMRWLAETGVTILCAILVTTLRRSYHGRLVEVQQLTTHLEDRNTAVLAREAQLEAILASTSEGILAVDRAGRVMRTNRRFGELWRIPEDVLERRDDRALIEHVVGQLADPKGFVSLVETLYESDVTCTDVVAFKDGRLFERYTAPLLLQGEPAGRIWSFRDITDRTRLEQAHLQAQKLASLGTLAGGIAHDFNNILTAIRGNVDEAALGLPADHPAAAHLRDVQRSADRAAELVRRIMTFARPGESRVEPIDLRQVTREVLELLRSTLPSSIELRTRFDAGARDVLADSTQVHEVLVNLTTNAAHAIGLRAGVITYALEPVVIETGGTAALPGLAAGTYTRLSVSDDGCGMDRATVERIFDAFYTTKPVGQGTGLGLSMVHGIMTSHGGAVAVESTPGVGSTFSLYFPVSAAPASTAVAPVPAASARTAGVRLLFVDDEPLLVSVGQRMLARFGHTVAGFPDPVAALEAFRSAPDQFDALVTDLAMPRLSGIDLARAVLAVRPTLPVLLVTGRISDRDRALVREAGIREVLLKPFGADQLSAALDRTLHGTASPAAPL